MPINTCNICKQEIPEDDWVCKKCLKRYNDEEEESSEEVKEEKHIGEYRYDFGLAQTIDRLRQHGVNLNVRRREI